MQTSRKLTCEERRASILQAVRHLFANQGFKGTRTRELAEAAGVSEALLYRHFPTKEALFEAIQQSFCDEPTRARFDRLNSLHPSTEALVLHVHFLTMQVLGGPLLDGQGQETERANQNRMILRSLAEDGAFARQLLQPFAAIFVPKLSLCLKAAIEAGDAVAGPLGPNLGGWLVYNLAAMTSFLSTPHEPVGNLEGDSQNTHPDTLVNQVVWFALRGLGLSEKAIKKYFTPRKLAAWELESKNPVA